ncbi:MAG: sterol desaturase family protein [Polyangiaceae bacterium]
MSNLLLYAIPGFLLSLWLERWWSVRARGRAGNSVRGYDTRDTLASLAMGVGNVIISAFTEAVERLPAPLEWLLNTPSHHRVHHGKNVAYLDRNHGGVLIVWDRLFGSFEREREAVQYGLTHDLHSFNPLRIASHEWQALARDLRRANSLREACHYVFAPPGWSPDGYSRSATELRRAAERAAENANKT